MPIGPRVPERVLGEFSPAETCVLAIDLGTGGPKAAVLNAKGQILAHAFQSVGLSLTPDGGAEQDPREWWAAALGASRKAIEESGVSAEQIIGVGCTAQWLGTVAIDGGGEPIGPAIIWMDSRGSSAVRRVVQGAVNALGYDVKKLAQWVRLTGAVPSISGKDPVGHIHFLREERPDVYASCSVFLEPVDFLNLCLTGVPSASHDSITAHWVTDNRKIGRIDYHRSLLDMAQLERAKLPDLIPTGTVVGGLCERAAAELGLLPGTPVVTGTGDLHSAAVGSGAVADFDAHFYIGTSSWISCHVPFKKTAPVSNITSLPSGIPGRYVVADEHETGGACLTWLRDNVLFAPDAMTGPAPGDFFAQLNDLAGAVPPGAHGVMFTPWLNGERSPVDDHTIRAGFHNLSLSSTRAEMMRAVLEGVAFNTKWLLGYVEKYCGRRLDTLAFVGGGANSALWSQIHADVTERTIRQTKDPVLANVRGAGLLTLLALGKTKVDDIPAMVETIAEFHPNQENAALYGEMADEFVQFYKQTKTIHRRLNKKRLSRETHGGA